MDNEHLEAGIPEATEQAEPSQEQNPELTQADNRELFSIKSGEIEITLASLRYDVNQLAQLSIIIKEQWFNNQKKKEKNYTS